MSIPAGRLGIRFIALVSVIMCVSGNSRAGRLHAPAPFALDNNVGRGVALRVPVARECRGPLVIPVPLLLCFACCGRVRVYGAGVGWDYVSESIAYQGVSRAGVCGHVDFRRVSCCVVVLQRIM